MIPEVYKEKEQINFFQVCDKIPKETIKKKMNRKESDDCNIDGDMNTVNKVTGCMK